MTFVTACVSRACWTDPRIGDVARDERDLRELLGRHDQREPAGIGAEVERHDGHAFVHELAHGPRSDAAERAGDEEALRGPAGFRRHVASL